MEASRSQLMTSWSSVGIALCALMLAFYSSCQTRKTTRLSARPYIEISFYFNDQGAGWTYRNFGLGPAVVNSLEVSFDGQRLRSWDELARQLGLGSGPIKFSMEGPGIVAPPYKTGDITEMFWVSPADRDKLVSNWSRVRISTCYCSLYNECWKSFSSKEQPDLAPQDVRSCKVIPAEERFGVEVR
jgi:hypothetical protein